MSQSSSSTMHWVSLLDQAAQQFDGGPRSFPLACEAGVASSYGYEPPNIDYQKLFFRQVTVPSSRPGGSTRLYSAGWLIPDETSVCNPVFIAHSTLSAIWLLRKTLARDALPDEAWDKLVCAAQDLARSQLDGFQEEPPSAQRPRESPPRSTKRALPWAAATTPILSSKRPRLRTESPSPTTPQLSQSEEPEEPVHAQAGQEELPPITTVTNNNRRAERARVLKREAAQAKKKLELGLIPPPDKAPRKEHGAYASISQQDEPFVAWIIKQPVDKDQDLFSSAAAPYATASSMLDKARAIGNASSQASAAAFLRSWRTQGTPFVQEPGESRPPASSRNRWQLTQRSSSSAVPQSALASAWSLCDRYEQELDIIHIKYRWAMAFLGKAYTEKMDEIRRLDAASSNDTTSNRYGKGKVSSEAIDALLPLVSFAPTPEQRLRFKKRLHQALRWYEAAKQLGWGMLCLMPHDIVTNSWVENDLRIRYWHVWLELVTKVNPVAHKASIALDAWLGSEGISGGSISDKETLSIEANAPTPATQVEEIEDSEDTENEAVEPAPSRATTKSPAPTRPMRQLTLLELCKPQA